MPQVIVNIGENGEAQIEVNGARGRSCLKITEGLEKSLGHVESRRSKPEMLAQETQGAKATAGRNR